MAQDPILNLVLVEGSLTRVHFSLIPTGCSGFRTCLLLWYFYLYGFESWLLGTASWFMRLSVSINYDAISFVFGLESSSLVVLSV